MPGQTYAVDQTVLSIGRTYDANGAPASVTSYDDASGTTGHEVNQISYTRDAWGNITSSAQDPNAEGGTVPTVNYTWGYNVDANDAASHARLEKVTLPGGREIYYNYESQYESLAKFASLNRVANIAANGSPDDANTYVAYKYLGASMVVDANHPAVPTGLRLTYDPNADKAYDGFDRFGRVLDANWVRTAGSAVDRFAYTYDRSSNRLTRSQPLKPAYNETYEYDFLDRLRDANRPGDSGIGSLDQSWTLRPTGNWASFISGGVEQTRTHNNANEITAITRSPGDLPDPLYGPAGCNVFGPKPNDDANGMHSRYDPWNRLATVHWDANSNGTLDANDTLRATYRYDGLNRRVRKVVIGDDANTTTEHAYHNTGWQVLEIRRGLDGAAPAATAYKQYAWDLRYIDAPVCRWWDADTDGQMEPTAGEQHYYTNDAQFNATALIDANSGAVVERYMYDPYGKPMFLDGNWTPITASAYENEVLYCGYRYDPETGLYHVRNRYYDPITGTWKTRDRAGYLDGMGLYGYCRNSPTGHTDRDGMAAESTSQPASTSDGGIPSPSELGRQLGLPPVAAASENRYEVWRSRDEDGNPRIYVKDHETGKIRAYAQETDSAEFSEWNAKLESTGDLLADSLKRLTPKQWRAKYFPEILGNKILNIAGYYANTKPFDVMDEWSYFDLLEDGKLTAGGPQSFTSVSNAYVKYHANSVTPYHEYNDVSGRGTIISGEFAVTPRFKQCCSDRPEDWGVFVWRLEEGYRSTYISPGKAVPLRSSVRRLSESGNVYVSTHYDAADPEKAKWHGSLVCLTCEKTGVPLAKRVMGCILTGLKRSQTRKIRSPHYTSAADWPPRWVPLPPDYGLLPDSWLPGYKNVSLPAPKP